jgi:hypothetical protein
MAAEGSEGKGHEGSVVPGWKTLFLAGTKSDTEWVISSMRETGQTPQMRGASLAFRYTATDAITAASRRGCKPTSMLCLNIDRETLFTLFIEGKASRHERIEPGIDFWDAKYNPEVMRFETQNMVILQGSKRAEGSEGGQGGDGSDAGDVALEPDAKRARR